MPKNTVPIGKRTVFLCIKYQNLHILPIRGEIYAKIYKNDRSSEMTISILIVWEKMNQKILQI